MLDKSGGPRSNACIILTIFIFKPKKFYNIGPRPRKDVFSCGPEFATWTRNNSRHQCYKTIYSTNLQTNQKVAKVIHICFLSSGSEAGLLNKSSCLAAPLGVTKIVTIAAMNLMNLITLCCTTWVRLRFSTNLPLASLPAYFVMAAIYGCKLIITLAPGPDLLRIFIRNSALPLSNW
jgi:hypothetical protein